jgi:transposase
MGRRRPARYSPEFRAAAVRQARETDAPLRQVAQDLGVNLTTLKSWLQAARPQPREPLTEDERSELAQLRRENQQLRTERDILKKATAFFARQSD